MFDASILFDFNKSELKKSGKKFLNRFLPIYYRVLTSNEFREYVSEIIIEGHTDTDGSYASNMQLSFERANAVSAFCLDEKNGLSKAQIEQLQQVLTVNGRSYSSPVYKKDKNGNNTTAIDMEASRRVEIKFRLKEDEMIEKIAEVLNKAKQ